MAAPSRRAVSSKKQRQLLQKRIMSHHATMLKEAPDAVKQNYAKRAHVHASVKQHDIQEEQKDTEEMLWSWIMGYRFLA